MRKKLIPNNEIINLSKDVINSFYGRNIEKNIDYLAEDFMWIGAFDFQYTLSKTDFLGIVQSELNSNPFVMMDEEFFVLSKSTTSYVVCGKFKLFAQTNNELTIKTHTRMTIIWKYVGDELKIIHIHGSNAQDISLYDPNPSAKLHPANDFFSSITLLNIDDSEEKIGFRTIDGKYKYFLKSEIQYLEANMQSTFVHTIHGCTEISGLLLENSKKLPENFYRIHKSYIVNCSLVSYIERYKATLSDDTKLPISKEKYINFREFLEL